MSKKNAPREIIMQTLQELAEKHKEKLRAEEEAQRRKEQKKKDQIEVDRERVRNHFRSRLTGWGVKIGKRSIKVSWREGTLCVGEGEWQIEYDVKIEVDRPDSKPATIKYRNPFVIKDGGVVEDGYAREEMWKAAVDYEEWGCTSIEEAAHVALNLDPDEIRDMYR